MDTLEKSEGNLPYAAVSGVAKADNSCLKAIRNQTIEGLISNFYVEEHSRDQKGNSQGSWYINQFFLLNYDFQNYSNYLKFLNFFVMVTSNHINQLILIQ